MAAVLPVFGLNRLRMGIDGEGVTTLVGALGCPLACRWCLNPRARNPETRCERLTAEQLIERLSIDHLYFAATGGGACFGGGDALVHAEFIAEFAKKRPPEWRITLETSLHAPPEALQMALGCTDEFIVDVKDLNPEIYRLYTGRDNAPVLANLKTLAAACPERVHLRIPDIPGFNAPDDCEHSVDALRAMGFTRIERFRYVVR